MSNQETTHRSTSKSGEKEQQEPNKGCQDGNLDLNPSLITSCISKKEMCRKPERALDLKPPQQQWLASI